MIIGYIRVSTDKQTLSNQKHKILEYAQAHKFLIDEFVEIEISSRKDTKARLIDEVKTKLKKDDILICTEISRLGRNMLEILNIIDFFNKNEVRLIFTNQPELSTNQNGTLSKLLFSIYSYFAETEREIISERTKQALEAVKAKGIRLGRPKGAKARHRILDPHKEEIGQLLKLKVSQSSILRIINSKLQKPISITSLRYFLKNEIC